MLNWFIMEVDNEGWIRKSIRKEGTEKHKKGGGEGKEGDERQTFGGKIKKGQKKRMKRKKERKLRKKK